MQACRNLKELNNMTVSADCRWNKDDSRPLLMHSVHVYPAKFPPLIAEEAFRYAEEEGVYTRSVADIFCGCGTVALESKKRGLDFWGVDINPVAVLIAKAKTNHYDEELLRTYYNAILANFSQIKASVIYDECYETATERLSYWFSEKNYRDLYCLKLAIENTVRTETYLTAFLCIFSSLLKSASRWLQKSIKPQVDPKKKDANVQQLFKHQTERFLSAISDMKGIELSDSIIDIQQADYLKITEDWKTDLIITSPPYVTSYEYADLHQLSSLWLGYTDDYRKLREGSIGSTYLSQDVNLDTITLNTTGKEIVNKLRDKKVQPSRVKAIGRYYSNMEQVVQKSARMLNKNGMALFVIGDSELKGVKLRNSRHLVESMIDFGFSDIKIGKRTIEKSMCIPFRDESGKFTKKSSSTNEIYHEEFVVSGRIR